MHISPASPQKLPDGSGLTQAAPTAAAAVAMIRAATDLTEKQRDKLCTAINRAVAALRPGEDPKLVGQHVPMTCATMMPLFRSPPAKLGMSASRFTSFRSELRRVLRRCGQHDPDYRGRPLASPALQALSEALPKERRLALIDYLRFLDRKNVSPDAACQALYLQYLSWCATRTLRSNPDGRAGQVASAWNWARIHIQGWPCIELASPRPGPAKGRCLEDCPASLARDLERYLGSLSRNDSKTMFEVNIFAESEGPRRPPRSLRPVTIGNKKAVLQGVVRSLLSEGVDPAALRTLTDLVDPKERVITALSHYVTRFKDQKSTTPWKVAEELRLLARDYCQLPQDAVDRIAGWSKNLKQRPQGGLTKKNKQRLRTLMQPLPRAMLLHLPGELMKRAKAAEGKPARAALLAMHAVALEILLICPLRRGNVAGLRLDVHVHRPDPRQSRITHIFLPADEVKNDENIEWPVPPESARLIETYIRRYRPHLVTGNTAFLFPGIRQDQPRSPQGLATWLSKTISREIGIDFNVHLARHFAAWNFLRQNPGHYEAVRQVLGHKNIKTTMDYYVGLDVDAAARRFDAVVLGERQASRKIATHAFRKGRGGLSAKSGKR